MAPAGEAVPPFNWTVVLSACGLGAMTALIQFVMNWAQRSVSPTRATLIYAGEPVWAGIIGRIAGERLPSTALVGGLLVVAAVIVSEIEFKRKKC
jgi:drug/metabolite transporter (DMT)-like permease